MRIWSSSETQCGNTTLHTATKGKKYAAMKAGTRNAARGTRSSAAPRTLALRPSAAPDETAAAFTSAADADGGEKKCCTGGDCCNGI